MWLLTLCGVPKDIISMLVEHRANIEARTAHSGLLVSKARFDGAAFAS